MLFVAQPFGRRVMHAFGVTASQAPAFQTGNPARFRLPPGLTLASLEVVSLEQERRRTFEPLDSCVLE